MTEITSEASEQQYDKMDEKLESFEKRPKKISEDSSLHHPPPQSSSFSSPPSPCREIVREEKGLEGEVRRGNGSQKRNKSAGPRLMIVNPTNEDEIRQTESLPSSSDCKPRKDFNFQFSNEFDKSFPVSGEAEAKIFSGSRKFITLDSLLSQNKQPMSCPVMSNQANVFVWRSVEEPATDEDKNGLSRRESFFKLRKEKVAQQRLISVDREQCHKREQAEMCMEQVPDIKQTQAVTVCRSNTWSFKNSSEAFEKLRSTSLKRQLSTIETEADLKSLRQRQRQNHNHRDNHKDNHKDNQQTSKRRQHPVIVERDEDEKDDDDDDERAAMSDDTEYRPYTTRHRSNTISNVVKSYSIVDRDFRLNQALVMWNRDLSAKMANRSSTGSIIDDKANDANDDSLVQKCVVLQRDVNGYGMTIAGDSPTYVQQVKENGAAARAGIQKGDKIIKVNGTLVTNCSHTEVNNQLRFGSYVNLTLLGRFTPGGQLVTSLRSLEDLKEKRDGSSSSLNASDKESDISTPKAVDPSKASHYQMQKIMTMRMMQKQIIEELEHLRQEYENCPTEQLCLRLESKKEMLDKVQEQLKSLQEVELPPKRPFSAGHELSDAFSLDDKSSAQTRPNVESQYDTRQSSGSGTLSTSPYQSRSIGNMLRKRCLKVVMPSQVKMGTVEDSDFSILEDPTIFTDLDQLKCHPAHLSVFLHYIMPNFDPSPMLFHIVTESYPQGSAKEMKKWAYEIYSTFLNEKSPLRVNVEEELTMIVESTLIYKNDDEDSMRNIFVPVRMSLANEIYNQLADFRAKRASGFGSIYGDQELRDTMDKATELKIIENGLWKYFERLSMNKNNDRCKALASALATFFKGVGLSSSKISSSLERCYTFNAKDKKTFRFKTNKKLFNGHQYIAQQYYVPTYCHWCHLLFWGIGHQGFQCSHCEMNVHKNCIEQTREPCSGVKKRKEKKASSSVFDKIISRKSGNSPLAVKEAHMHEVLPFTSTFVAGFSNPSIHTMAPVLNGENEEMEHSKSKRSSSQDPSPDQRVKVEDSSFEVTTDLLNPSNTIGSSNSVIRSESLQGKLDTKVNVRRAHSDVTPENQPTQPHFSDSSGCSSNSSLSAKSSELQIQGHEVIDPQGSMASPVVVTTGNQLHPLHGQHSLSSFSSTLPANIHQHPFISHSLSSLVIQPQQLQTTSKHLPGSISDSDFEVDSELPSIESYVSKEQLKKLKPKERKRQEVINELFHTEQAHVRNLKVMYRIFYQPMVEEASVPRDLINLIFPNLQGLIDCHCALNEEFKVVRKGESVVGDFAHILEEKFSGEEGERLKNMAATFCQNQSQGLEVLRVKQKKDGKFAAFLQEAASHPLCRRLELKDLIPTEMQRLTKYPLLIENLLKYTQTNTNEYEILQRALEQSKSILSYVDQRVKECENLHKLTDLQRRLDTKPIENSTHPVLAGYKKLDLRRHKMIYDGPMTWRICKSKQLEMHAVLLEDILVLLQKPPDSEKLVLRCQSSNLNVSSANPLVGGVVTSMGGGKDDTKLTHSPIVKLTNILLRNVATDKKAFFLVSISECGPQIYEFVASTRDEKNRWFKYISDAAEAYKHKKGITDKTVAPSSSMRGYMSGSNVVTTGGQEAEMVQPSSSLSLPLLSSSISSIIPDDVAHLKVAKVDPAFQHKKSQSSEMGHYPTREVRSRSRSRSFGSDSDGHDVAGDDNMATVMIVDEQDEGLVHPNEVKVSTMQVLERFGDAPASPAPEVGHDLNAELSKAMREKKRIVASILGIPLEDYDNIAEIAQEEAEHSTDVKEILLALLAQTDHLTELINKKTDHAGEGVTKMSASSVPFNRMVTIPSSQIFGISTKLNQFLLQLTEVLLNQERELASQEQFAEESQQSELALHSTNQNSQRTQDQPTHGHDSFKKPPRHPIVSLPSRNPAYIENSCVTSLEAKYVESPKLETGHVLTTSVNPLFCGVVPTVRSLSPPPQFVASPSNNNNSDDNDRNNNSQAVFTGPPMALYTSTCQLPRLVERQQQQPIKRSEEADQDDEVGTSSSNERALTVL